MINMSIFYFFNNILTNIDKEQKIWYNIYIKLRFLKVRTEAEMKIKAFLRFRKENFILRVSKQSKRKHLVPDMLSTACKMFEDSSYHKKTEKPIPSDFFRKFLLFGKYPLPNILKHLAYAGAVFTTKELLLIYGPVFPLEEIGLENIKRFAIQIPKWDIPFHIFSPSESMKVSNQYIFESSFDETSDLILPTSYCFTLYSMMSDMWGRGYLNDYFLFDLVVRGISRYMVKPFKKETTYEFGVSQWVAMVIMTDFVRQIAESDYDCSGKAMQAYKLMKRNFPMDYCNRPVCRKMTKTRIIEYLQIVSNEPFCCRKHKGTDFLFQLKPYLSEQSQKVIEMAEKDIIFYEAAIRQIYFGTQTCSTNVSNMYEECILAARLAEVWISDTENLQKQMDKERITQKGYLQDVKALKSELRKSKKEMQKMEQRLHDIDNHETEGKMRKKIETLEQEKKQAQDELSAVKDELIAVKGKHSKYHNRIETLASNNETLKKQKAVLEEEIKQKDKIITGLIEDYSAMFPEENTDVPDISDEAWKLQNCANISFLFRPLQIH